MVTLREREANTVGGRAVLNEAIQVAVADLESGEEFVPIVVTKDWGDCRVERFGADELQEARARMRELLSGSAGAGHCALAHDEQLADGRSELLIQIGRMGGEEAEAFAQRYRPRRGRFRPFKLLGSPAAEGD